LAVPRVGRIHDGSVSFIRFDRQRHRTIHWQRCERSVLDCLLFHSVCRRNEMM
jgi:hypothetical protein